MIDIQSIAIYSALAILTYFIAAYAERTQNKKAVWTIVVMLSLIAGMRATSVGIDTKTYEKVIETISSGRVEAMFGIEKSFIYICAVLLKIWNSSAFLFSLFAFISHSCILLRIWCERETVSFKWATLTYYIMFFAFSLNGMRQFIAAAIVIYATKYIKDGKYLKFLIALVLTTLFHTSAVVGIGFLLIDLFYIRTFDKRRKKKVLSYSFLMIIFSAFLIPKLVDRYADYFEMSSISIGAMVSIKLLMLVLSLVLIGKPKNNNYLYSYSTYRTYYTIGLIMNSLSYFFLYMGRVGIYYYIFEAFYIGNIFKMKNKTVWVVLLKIGYAFILLYYMYENLTSSAQGELPYRFFWQC